MLRVAIVDDDSLVLGALKTIIEAGGDTQVVGTAASGEEAVPMYIEKKPDIILLDIRMNGMTGLEAGKKILETDKQAKILFLTTFSDDEYIFTALKIGAKGYILKQHYDSILPSLKAVMMGQSVFGEEIISKLPALLMNSNKVDNSQFGLIEKEIEIITLIAKGKNNKEIAAELYLGEGTLRNYISVILEKLNLRDRTQIAIFYYTTGMDT